MRRGDYVVVIRADDEYFGGRGIISGLTKEGRLTVQFDGVMGPRWEVSFDAHDLELSPHPRPLLYWEINWTPRDIQPIHRED